MNWPFVICIVIVFICGFKIGQFVMSFKIATGMQTLSHEDQVQFRLLLNKMGKKNVKQN